MPKDGDPIIEPVWVLWGWHESKKKLFKFNFHLLVQKYAIEIRSVLINVDI